jgi:hypothetical protein
MYVICPNCGEKATAENINIQEKTAVCAACDTVFPFKLPSGKVKRRKVKQPVKLTLHDTETLHMEFWTNFRLERSEAFVGSTLGGVSMTFVALLLIGVGGVPFVVPLVLLLIAVAFFYWLALTVVNKTHIEMDEEAIKVTRKPIPNLLNQGYEVPLAGVTALKYEETAISKKESYDTPRYRVWAEMVDGSRRTIVNDVTQDYAVFIAQRLEEHHLHLESDEDGTRIENSGYPHMDEEDMHWLYGHPKTMSDKNPVSANHETSLK